MSAIPTSPVTSTGCTAEPALFVGFTSVAGEEDAGRLADALIDSRLAACVQIDGPVTSRYFWNGVRETATEWRLTVKFTAENADAITAKIAESHPYETPEWVVIRAHFVLEKYLRWARGV